MSSSLPDNSEQQALLNNNPSSPTNGIIDLSNSQQQQDNTISDSGQSFHILEYNNKLLNQLELNHQQQQLNNNPTTSSSSNNNSNSSINGSISSGSNTLFHSIQCLIYWDYENISLSSNTKASTVTTSVFLSSLVNRLEYELQQYYNNYLSNNNQNTTSNTVVQIKVNTPFIKVYGDMYQIPKYRRTEFYQNGCHLIDVPHLGTTRKEVVDKMMLTDVLMDLNIYNRPIFNQFVNNNQSNTVLPSTAIILLTGDQDFCHLLSRLKYQSIPSVVIIKKDQTQHGGSMYDSDSDQSINTLLQSSTFWVPFENIYNDSMKSMKFEKERLLNGGGLLSTNGLPSSQSSSSPPNNHGLSVVSNGASSTIGQSNGNFSMNENNSTNGSHHETTTTTSSSEKNKEMSIDEYIESIAPQTPRELLPKDIKLISFILLKYLEPLELGNLSSQLVNLNITPKKLKKFIESYDSSQFIELIKTKNSTNILLVDRKKILKLLPNGVSKQVVMTKKKSFSNIQSALLSSSSSSSTTNAVVDEGLTEQRIVDNRYDDENDASNNSSEAVQQQPQQLVEPAFAIGLEEYMVKYLSAPTKRDLNSTDMYLICFILLLEDNMELGALSSRLYQYRVKPRSLKKNLIEFNTMGDRNGQLVGIFRLEQRGNMLFIALTDRRTVMNILPHNVEFRPLPAGSSSPLQSLVFNNSSNNLIGLGGGEGTPTMTGQQQQLISPNLNQLIPKQQPTTQSAVVKLATTTTLDSTVADNVSSVVGGLLRESASSSLSSGSGGSGGGGNSTDTAGTGRNAEEEADESSSIYSSSTTTTSGSGSGGDNIEGKKSITNDILMELEDTVKEFKDQKMSYLTVKNHYTKLGFNTKHLQRKIVQLSPHLNVVQRGNEMVIEYQSEKTQSIPSNLNNLQVYSKKEHKIATFHDILKIIEDLSSSYPYEADLSLVGTIVKQLGWRVEGNMKLKDFLQMNDTSQILQFDKTKNNWMIKIKKKKK